MTHTDISRMIGLTCGIDRLLLSGQIFGVQKLTLCWTNYPINPLIMTVSAPRAPSTREASGGYQAPGRTRAAQLVQDCDWCPPAVQ